MALLHGEMGVDIDVHLAKKWLIQAGKQNLAAAQYQLGLVYWRGIDGWPADPEKSFLHTERAAQQRMPEAEYLLHLLYRSGTGTKRDMSLAHMWLQRSVEHGHEGGLSVVRTWSELVLGKDPLTEVETMDKVAAELRSGGKASQQDDELQNVFLDKLKNDALRYAGTWILSSEFHSLSKYTRPSGALDNILQASPELYFVHNYPYFGNLHILCHQGPLAKLNPQYSYNPGAFP